MTRAKGTTNNYDFVINRERAKRRTWAMPQRVMVGDYDHSLQQIRRYYPGSVEDMESGSMGTMGELVLSVGALIVAIGIAAVVMKPHA